MKKILFSLITLLISAVVFSQSTGYLRYDTVRVQKVGGNSTLIIENATRNVVGGVLTNMGGGRTEFVTPGGGADSLRFGAEDILNTEGVGRLFDGNGEDFTIDNTGTLSLIATSVSIQGGGPSPNLVGGANGAIAIGQNNTGLGLNTFSIGQSNYNEGLLSLALGEGNYSGGDVSIAMGYLDSAFNSSSVAMGNRMSTHGNYSFGISLSGARKYLFKDSTFQVFAGMNNFFKLSPDSIWTKGLGLKNDSTNYKIRVVDPVTGHEGYSNWIGGAGGSTPGIDDVLAVGQTLTTDRSINLDDNDLEITGVEPGMTNYFKMQSPGGIPQMILRTSGNEGPDSTDSEIKLDGKTIQFTGGYNATPELMYFNELGLQVNKLAGTGNRIVYSNASGVLGNLKLGTGVSISNDTLYGTGSSTPDTLFSVVNMGDGAPIARAIDDSTTGLRSIVGTGVTYTDTTIVLPDNNLVFDSLGAAGISPVTTWNNTLYGRRISISGGSIDTTASGGLLITVPGSTFASLSDGPGAFTGQTLKSIRVNAGETALEYYTPAGAGDVVKVGTPVDNQIGVWTGNGTIEGPTTLTWSGSQLAVVGAGTSIAGIDLFNGAHGSLLLGADANVATRTNATNKFGGIAGVHYTNAEEPVSIVRYSATSTASTVNIGSGVNPGYNSATNVDIYTATTNTTLAGIRRVTFDANSKVRFNDTQINYDFQISGDNDANAFWVDASSDFVGIGVAVPATKLDVVGVISTDGLNLDRTITAGGTTGDQTINKVAGTVNFATGTSTLTVTNSLVNASSIIFCEIRTNDAAAIIKNVVAGAGSFVITLNAATGAETSVGFLVTN